jgi:hypothetical protein
MAQHSRRLFVLLLALALPMGACSKKADETATTQTTPAPATSVSVTGVDLGKSVGSDNRVTEPAATFSPKDVIYATVLTSGSAPNTVIRATWLYQDGQVVSQSERTIAPNGAAATEFHIEKPDGLPPGKYRVQVSIDGNPVQEKEFEVTAS